ncbi:solute carrier family 52, riboflavin transporter, member 3 isoform X4 [Serinus canaria]|uniref:solute carrier family 52, riboflavin transporter, member 3 isoform X4 n=1 Tax=Serinus canaria TaxID=9135 RepID=UPI0008DB4847|nr:solute carrier family 52, riboflavin transporter, member 3 isoform X4 [Serinus canaria]
MALLTHILACAFGMGSWVAINGLWVEVPLLVTVLPEQWYLPSYITIIIQMANVGPLFVTLMNRFRPGLLKEGSGISSCTNVSYEVNNTTGNETEESTFHLETRYLPPNFSTLIFFLLMTAMMLICLLAFFFLTRQPKVWELSQQHLFPSNIVLNSFDQILDEGADSHLSRGCSCPKDPKGPGDILPQKVSYSLTQLTLIYLLIAWVSALTNGILPSVQSYSCLPYGHTTYHLAATLSSMANPLACIVAMFLPSRSLTLMVILTMAGTGFGAYNMAIAVMSPCPLLQQSQWGDVIIVLSWVLFTGTLSYMKVMAGVILRSRSRSALVWYGVLEQLGSLLGALLMFPLVNVYGLFKSADYCSLPCPA